ncbi:putative porin [Salinimicrobium sediminilitoris]|uniref:putative porin n=1 Tax=Salinimicrobium sediminilitoris TaxID=2876715 RepID=UPI001E56E4A6|nr:putative porin [Salinimicrobium sediminilitoris]MCC8360454.1 putative porin [Salinimicrobium sediminilitoris]
MKKKQLLFLYLLLIPIWGISQERKLTRSGATGSEREMDAGEKAPEVERAPIELYKIISVENDTTIVDTTLNIYKDYRFNYLRKDNFGLLAFSNVGRSYNRLTYDFLDERFVMPQFGARARHYNFMEVEDIYYYNVPTPFTELFFKTVFEQGQAVDALFTVNTSPNLNFSVAYKGLRSLGRYKHLLTSTGNFRATLSYDSPNERYRLQTHFVSQDLLNEENGGLTEASLEQYVAKNPEFEDRSRLDVNFQDAQSTLFGKRFFLDHSYALYKRNDSLAQRNLTIGHRLNHTYKKYRFQQGNANEIFGPSFEEVGIRDETRLTSTSNEVYVGFTAGNLAQIVARGRHTNYDYGYNTVLDLQDGFITNRLQGNIISAGGDYTGTLGGFQFKANGMVNLIGDLKGYDLGARLAYVLSPDFSVAATANINDCAPDYNFLLYQSDYINYNWQTSFSNESRQSLGFDLWAPQLLNASLEFTTINDMAYFALDEMGSVRPFQHEGQVSYFKVKGEREFSVGKFALNNTVLFQSVLDGGQVFNVPDLVTRNTLYYRDHWFQRALYLQTGFTLNYFTGYNLNGYDPVLAEFYVQNEQEFDGFPTVDFFFNGKIRQARIFFKLENLNYLIEGNNNFSAPLYPSRDFGIRFGLVWNFFM